MDYQKTYIANQSKQASRYDNERFSKFKDSKKELEFFKGLNSQINNIANNIEAGNNDLSQMSKLEELLAQFNALYNSYYAEIARNPQNKASEPMRNIMNSLRNSLQMISQASPQYARQMAEHLKNLDAMYVKTGGSTFIKGVPTPQHLSGGSLGTYTGDTPDDINMYEPSIMERINKQHNIERYENHKYTRLQMNDDFN
jgi:hypothetical protein